MVDKAVVGGMVYGSHRVTASSTAIASGDLRSEVPSSVRCTAAITAAQAQYLHRDDRRVAADMCPLMGGVCSVVCRVNVRAAHTFETRITHDQATSKDDIWKLRFKKSERAQHNTTQHSWLAAHHTEGEACSHAVDRHHQSYRQHRHVLQCIQARPRVPDALQVIEKQFTLLLHIDIQSSRRHTIVKSRVVFLVGLDSRLAILN